MHHQLKTAVLILSIITLLFTGAFAALGEPAPQVGQSQVETQKSESTSDEADQEDSASANVAEKEKPAPKPAPPKDLATASVQQLKQEHPGIISRVIDVTRNLVIRAHSWLGARYVWGGTSRRGVDCSGLTQLLLREEGIHIPRTARQQFQQGRPVARGSLLPGDLVFFNTRGPISHVGLYIGNGQFIHAANPRRGVRVDRIDSAYYNNRYAGARRYKDLNRLALSG